jgi:hypothetical protein
MIETNKNDGQAALRRAITSVAVIGLLAAVLAWVLAGPRASWSIGFGAGLAAANLWALGKLVRVFVTEGGPKAPWAFLALVKFSALVAAVVLLVRSGIADLLALGIGYGALPVGIVIAQLWQTEPLRGEN